MMEGLGPLAVQAFEIVWINILLSGDNAVVIALACRQLTGRQRQLGILLGAGAAVLLRVIFTGFTASLMALPWLKVIGALLLLWIAVKLLVPDEGEENVAAHTSLWAAVQTIAVADIVMSLDNVIAIAAVAKGSLGLIVFGLVLSVPLVVFGSQLILAVIERFPVIVWAGAALLGWVAGEIFVEDTAVARYFGGHYAHLYAEISAALFVVLCGLYLRRRRRRTEAGDAAG